ALPERAFTLPAIHCLGVVTGSSPGPLPSTTSTSPLGKAGKGGNRVTLLRRSPGTNTWTQHVYIEGLHSPFGIQLIGDTLYVA
ncbi:sorbosone dehydrogenase family protein, partial [Escherichia coli]